MTFKAVIFVNASIYLVFKVVYEVAIYIKVFNKKSKILV